MADLIHNDRTTSYKLKFLPVEDDLLLDCTFQLKEAFTDLEFLCKK